MRNLDPSTSPGATPVVMGRELDALIAEKVMGWRFGRFVAGDPLWRDAWWTGDPAAHDSTVAAEAEWSPSTNIADAWLVVEEMNRRGWIIDVQNRRLGMWACHIHFPAPDYRKVFECEDTAPHAICLAALLAVGAA